MPQPGEDDRPNHACGMNRTYLGIGSLWVVVALVATLLTLALVLFSNVLVQEFRPVPDDLVSYSWESAGVMRNSGRTDCTVVFTFYAERPFSLEFIRYERSQTSDSLDRGVVRKRVKSSYVSSHRQLLGHDAVLKCELRCRGSEVTIADVTAGRQDVLAVTLQDATDIACMGTPIDRMPRCRHDGTFVGRGSGFAILTSGCAGDSRAGRDEPPSFSVTTKVDWNEAISFWVTF